MCGFWLWWLILIICVSNFIHCHSFLFYLCFQLFSFPNVKHEDKLFWLNAPSFGEGIADVYKISCHVKFLSWKARLRIVDHCAFLFACTTLNVIHAWYVSRQWIWRSDLCSFQHLSLFWTAILCLCDFSHIQSVANNLIYVIFMRSD